MNTHSEILCNPSIDNTLSNGEFLRAAFTNGQDDLGEMRPVLVSFTGSPATAPGKAWFGKPWSGDADVSAVLPATANNYFSLAIFRPDEAGRFRRQKARFHALHAVMLDDLGSKVALDRLTLPPSWLLETSPGNYQAGYLLREPLSDGIKADRLMNAIVAAGLCDPGANGPQARLARLPVAVNGKHVPPFSCRMQTWSPSLRYSIDELVSGLQLDMGAVERPNRKGMDGVAEPPADGDQVWIPRPAENPVLAALRSRGLIKSPLSDGKYDVTCPWVEEHSDEIDSGTAYFEPNDQWPIGGFKCMHGHCTGRKIRDLLRFLDIEVGAARMKSTIRVVPGEIHRVVDAAERELSQLGRYYQRGGVIVNVVKDPVTGDVQVQEVSLPALVGSLSGAATWERFDGRSESWVRADPPARHVGVLFNSRNYTHLSALVGIARQPYLRRDGSLMTAAGYDKNTGMYGAFDTSEFSIPENPSRSQAETALEVLKKLLAEFSLAGDSDYAAALAAILTAAVRPSLSMAPLFHVYSHVPGSGKSYLCELVAAFSTPRCSTPANFPSDDEECRKFLLAELLRAPAVIDFDNLTGDLIPHKSLCTTLTSEYLTARILGVSKTAAVSTRTLFLSNGNNVGPVQDMTRRCITIYLDPGSEVPAARSFARPDLVGDVILNRAHYVSAALTIIRGWIVAGRPITACRPLANFGEWSEYCRQPLLWLGYADPTASVFQSMQEDPDRESLSRLLTAWKAVFGKAPAMVRDAVGRANAAQDEYADLREILQDIAAERGEINRRKLGWWIKRHAGRIVNGLRFVRASGNRSAEAWQVEVVKSVSPVSSVLSGAVVECVR